jgi:HEAT repeat protein
VRALAVCGRPTAVPGLEARLTDVDPAVRAAALLALAHLHQRWPEAVTPALDRAAECLRDDDGLVRQVAADALAQCGDDAVPALARILFQQSHEGARTRAAGALRKIATMKAAGVLYALLNDPNPLVRTYAYEGLDDMGLLETVLVMPQ